ncbi:MAG: RHS repeat protein [Clostridiales bacterium]|nr:RHS repeat protein [Clostridiales bacterium]
MKREIIKQRSRFVKHYDLGHGRRQAVLYPRAVHFRDQDEWKDIDNQLIAGARDGKAVWHNQDNPMKAEFARNAQEEMLARIEYDGHVVEWGFAEHAAGRQPRAILRANNARRTEEDLPEKMVSGVEYEEANPGVGVRYTLNGAGCKEEIIVKNREALRFASVLFKSNDLSFRAMEDNSIEAFKGEEAVFRFAPPVVSDSGEIEDMPIGFTLTETEAGTRMDYLLAENFLEEAVFPIIIDPSVEVVNETTNLDDTFLCQNHPTTNYNTKSYVEVGWQDSNQTENVALFRFKELVPLTAGDTVVKAELSLAVVQSTDYAKNPKYVGLYEILKDWTASSVTWNTFNPKTAGNISDVAQDCIIRTDRTRVTFDITNLYRSWYKVNRNFGVALRRPVLKNNTVWNYTQFRTRNYGSSSAPLLTVTYVSHVGIEKRWDYESMSAGRAGVVNTGVFNGNSVVSHPDIAMDGLRKPIAIGHYYNSCECNDTSYFAGNGWRTSMHQTVHSEVLGDTTHYVWTDGDGTRHYFPIEGSSPYADEDGMNLKLTYNSTTVTITDRMDNVMTFTKNSGWNKYWITKMNDSMENAITVTYSVEGKINRVTDPIGRYVQYTYDGNGRLSKLQALSAAGADIGYPYCTYTYSAAGDLINVGYSDITGKTTYAYSNHLLTQMTNYDGQSVTIGYEGVASYDGIQFTGAEIYPALRVLSMEHKAGTTEGAKLLFDYRHMSTHVTSVTGSGTSTTGKKLIYQFSDQGNIVSIRDELGYAAYATYGEELPNHADKASKLQRTVVNMLKNHSFEKTTDWTTSLENSAAGTHSYATDQELVGNKSAKMQRTNASGAMRISQTVNVTSGKTYTLSCFVRTDVSGVTCQARAVCGGTTHNGLAMSSVGEWSRISVTFNTGNATTATVSFSAQGTAGNAWFDCAQLEEGEVANRYNLIENGNFEYVSGSKPLIWVENSENDEEDIIKAANDGLHPEYLGGNVLKIKGYPNKNKGVYQEIIAKGSAGDVYVVGGWSKGRSRPTRDYPQRYAMEVQFYNSSSAAWEEADPVGWNEEWTEWQYSSGMVEAPVSYSKIRVYVQYEYNVNEAEFDGIALYKEAFGERYNYNSDGTVRNVTTMAGNRDIRLYDNYGNMSEYAAPGAGEDHYKRMHFGFENDARKKHLLRYQNSPMYVQDVYEYDTYGNQTAHKRQDTDAATAIRSTKAYTSNGDKLASATDPRGLTVSYAYNNNDTTSQVTMPNGQAVTYSYDAQKRITAAQASNGNGNYKNAYTYENDRIKTISHNTTSDTNDVTYTFGYDAFGKPTTVSVGSQVLSTNTYDADRKQKLRKVTYGNGQYIENEYDDFDRLTGVKWNGAQRYQYAYGANGQAARVIDKALNRVIWNEFDEANRPKSLTIQDGTSGALLYKTTLAYDDLEHLSKLVENAGGALYTTTYEYDWDNRPTEIRYGSSTQRVKYTYDSQGRLLTRRVVNGNADQTSTFSYAASSVAIPGLSTAPSTNLVSGISQPGIAFAYGYAVNTDNITSENRTGGSYAGTTTYAYDTLGQLTRVNDPVENATWVYTYDRGGNMTSKVKYAYTTGALGSAVATTNYTYDGVWKDKLLANGSYPLTYDAMGNLASYGGWTYTWEGGRQLKQQVQNATVVTYGYDHKGRRISKKVSNTDGYEYSTVRYYYSGDKITHLTHLTDVLHFYYDGQGRPAIVNYNGGTYHYLYNLQGDVIGLVDTSGNIVVEYKYNAWGSKLGRTGSMANTLGLLNPFRYRGYVYDEETWMYCLKSRYYYPELHRFINADVLLGKRGAILSHNLFAYCTNNPVITIDVHGQATVCVLYDGRPDEKEGGKGFPIQAAWWEKTLISQGHSVTMEGFESIDEFVQDWNNLGEYDRLIIVAHGAEGTLDCAGQRLGISSEAGSQYPITHLSSELQEKNIGMTMLFTCHGATDGYGGISLADIIADKTRSVVYAARNAKINYIPDTGMPYLSGEGLIGNLKTALWGYWTFVFPDGG